MTSQLSSLIDSVEKKLMSSKNEFDKIRQINKELQQKINELKTINKTILFQSREPLFCWLSFIENKYYNILVTSVSRSIKKLTKYFNSEPFINCQKDFK